MSDADGAEHPLGLEPDEQIRAHVVVSVPRAQRREQRRQKFSGYEEIPVFGLTTTLAVTDRRLIVYRPTFLRGRPRRYVTSLPLRRVAQVVAHRRLSPHLTVVLDDGSIREYESYGGMRSGRRFARAVAAAQAAL